MIMKTAPLLCALLLALMAPIGKAADDYSFEAAKSATAAEQKTEIAVDPRDQLYFDDRKRHDNFTIVELAMLGVVAVATIIAAIFAAKLPTAELSGRDLIRSIVLVFVIFGALALAIDVKTTETLTGVIGVLSATAGYLFGRATSTADEKPRRDARPDEKEP